MEKLCTQFIRERRFLLNVSPRTIKYYEWMCHTWNKHIGEFPDKINIKEFVIKLQESGVTPHTTNSYIRGINAFLTWLHENKHTPELLRMKKIKEPEKVLKLFSESQLSSRTKLF